MKYYIVLIIALILFSCNSEEVLNEESKKAIETAELKENQITVKEKLMETALIVAEICSDNKIVDEIAVAIQNQPNKFVSRVKLKELFEEESLKSSGLQGKFSKAFRNTLIQSNLKSSSTLIDYLIENEIEIYIPFGLDDYPEGTDIVVTFDPLDNDFENIGYFTSDVKKTVIANEKLADKYPIIIIRDNSLSYDEIVEAREKEKSDNVLRLKSISTVNPLTVWNNERYKFEIWIDKLYIKNDHVSGLFASPATMYVSTGTVSFNTATSGITDTKIGEHNVFSMVLDRQKVKYAKDNYLKGFIDMDIRWIQDWHPGISSLQWSFYLDRPKVTNESGFSLTANYAYEATVELLKLTRGGSSTGNAKTTSESNDHLYITQTFYRSTYKDDYHKQEYWSTPKLHGNGCVYVNSEVGWRAVSKIHPEVFYITHCEARLR